MSFEVRKFEDRDWPEVWSMLEQVAREGETMTYPRDMGEAFGRQIWVTSDPSITVVAIDRDSGAVLGSAKMGSNQMGPGSHVATASFMTATSARGRGIARALCLHALSWAREKGFAAMQFNAVVETNAPAVGLWTSCGFEILATIPEAFEHPRHGRVGLHVMHRML